MGVRRGVDFGERWMDFVMTVRHLEQIEVGLELKWEIWAGDKLESIWEIEEFKVLRMDESEQAYSIMGKGFGSEH